MENKKGYSPILKTLDFRIRELYYSLNIIKDSLQLLSDGKHYQMIPLWGQLRALLHQNGQKPLIIDLIEELNFDDTFYFPTTINDQDQLIESTVLLWSKYQYSFHAKNNWTKFTLKNFINLPIFIVDSKSYSISAVFKLFADKFGGAHYDKNYPEYIHNQYPLESPELNIFNEQIIEFSNMLIDIGSKILNKFISFQNSILFEIKNYQDYEINLFEFFFEKSVLTYSLKANRLFLIISDDFGYSYKFDTEIDVDLNIQKFISATHFFDNKLNSVFNFYIDGEFISSRKISSIFTNFNNNFKNCLINDIRPIKKEGIEIWTYHLSHASFISNSIVLNEFSFYKLITEKQNKKPLIVEKTAAYKIEFGSEQEFRQYKEEYMASILAQFNDALENGR